MGRIQPGNVPPITVAQTIYHGDYEGLPGAWGEFDQWIAEQGHHPAADRWECYRVGPESSNNPEDWRTELNRPVVGEE